ncbi:helix-turn-helix domain-containing protein [Brevibacillus borstelensis]|uniref:helix-turn-helix domain-containing protein n=1 Tax=Brevibacillus borstelensis TaxID=45462 RepID=UPI000AEA8E97|nr:helix-turn-helix domain-containing protein [Brevibacillus borstelensis]
MSYMEFKPLVKKVNMKPKGIVEIVLETSISDLQGKIEPLSSMIDRRAEASLDSLVVNYNVTINTKTNKPVIEYKVDDTGIVQEVKSEGEQLEAELGLPKEKIPTKEEQVEADRSVIDDFIREGFAPEFYDTPYDIRNIIQRKLDGETYMKIASELGLSSGRIVELVDRYYTRIAPLAMKWDEWRKSKAELKKTEESKPVDQNDAATEEHAENQDSAEDDKAEGCDDSDEQEASAAPTEQPEEDPKEGTDGGETQDVAAAAIDKEKLEAFILSGQAPSFEGITFDFPDLLQRKKNGETWIELAKGLGVSSGKLQTEWREYKKLVTEHLAKLNSDGEQGAA